jgi:nickel-dependent lactate racemase
MKIQLKGFVHKVSEVVSKASSDRSTFNQEQSIIIMVPGYTDQFGDKKGKDEFWEFKLFNDKIDRFNIRPHFEGKKVVVDGFLNSRTYKKNGEDAYVLSLVLADIKTL